MGGCFGLVFWLNAAIPCIGQDPGATSGQGHASLPPRVAQAQRFLARRGFGPNRPTPSRAKESTPAIVAKPQSTTSAASWQPLGPTGVITANYGLVTGRISSLALDASDATGNRLFVGTTGGGVWFSQNAAASNPANIVFVPLTDNLGAMSSAMDSSISIGALSVQPGGTGVILAGTGDPNDALDSYYGAGILRSTDGGTTWALIQAAKTDYNFLGEGFAGFAWSTINPQLVVAAVSQAWEGVLVGAQRSQQSYEGLYYSTDSGATWALAQITDLNGQDVQGPLDAFANPDGNAATSVVWNPLRGVFIAAVRFHGYYQSTDGSHWTRLAAQPGAGLTTAMCPTRPTSTGSTACPIYRGTLAVNPLTGDTFAWTVDVADQDQGLWQDVCSASQNVCGNQAIAWGKQWNTAGLESDTWLGSATILDGSYNLTLAAVPSGQDTTLLAGDNDLWKCSLAMGCAWRNTTNATACMSAQVAEYQHTVAWNPANPLELFVGNDGGLWRSSDGIGESGPVCSASDATHFQNLNGGLGSLAEIESMSAVGGSPYTMMLGLGANGTAGVKSTTGPTTDWPQILTGEGGPVAIDPGNPNDWYVNNGAGVSIHLCSQSQPCTPGDFGSTPVVTNADVNGDGLTMGWPASFLVDPVDSSQLLIGTCRVWRGPANGIGWTSANAIGPMFDGNRSLSSCNGNALVRSIAAMGIAGGGEVVYVGMYGSLNGGATLPGHVLTAKMSPSGTWSGWQDLSLNPVVNDQVTMNFLGFDISSLFIDPQDRTGNTIYATVAGIPNLVQYVGMVYRSTDGGAHWSNIRCNLPASAANSVVLDPQDSNTAYIATDAGVYITHNVASCAGATACWSQFGSGLPDSPVVALSAAPATTSPHVLVAGTFGRGVWQIPLATAGTQLTTAAIAPATLDFGTQGFGLTSAPQTVTLTNTGGIALLPGPVTVSGDFSETDTCANSTVNSLSSCAIQVKFRPTQSGSRTGQLSVAANVAGGNLTVALSGTGAKPGVVNLTPPTVDFGQVQVGSKSNLLPVTAENAGGTVVAISSITTTGPFVLATNSCGTTSLAASTDCQLQVQFAPAASGPASGTLTMVDDAGTQTVQLTGSGAAPPTDALSPSSLTFAGTIVGQSSPQQTVTLTNSGDVPLTSIAAIVHGPFQLTNDCTAQLAANSHCSLSIVFTPTQPGSQTGSLAISDSVNAGQTVSLSGMGLKPPEFSVSPGSLTFAAQPVGVPSSAQTLTVKNIGDADAARVDFSISGLQAGSFSAPAVTNTCGATLTAGSTCTVQVVFTPVSSGGAQATLNLTSSNAKPFPGVPLNGTGQTVAGLNVSPAQLTFNPQALNQASVAQAVTVSNTGGTSAADLTLTVSGPFGLSQNNCGTSLAAGASCTAGVVFTPTSPGNLTGMLTVRSSSVATPATVALSGIGGLTGAVQISPSQINFPTAGVGSTSSPVTVTITNSGAAVELDDLKLVVSAGFKLANSSCQAKLAAGASCTVDVTFAPSTTGAQSGTFTLTSSVLAVPVTLPLSGMGFDFQATASGASTQTVSSGQTATYSFTLTPSAGTPATFTLQCGSLPSYAACSFSPSSLAVAAGSTGSPTLQVTTSQSISSALRPVSLGGWEALPPVFAIILLPLALRGRRRMILPMLGVALLGAAGLTACSSSGGGSGGTPPPPVTHTTPAGTYSIPVTIGASGVQHTVTLTLVVD